MAFEVDASRYYHVSDVAEAVEVTRRTLYRGIEQDKVKGPGYERQRDKRRFFSQSKVDAVATFANQVAPVADSPDQMKLFNGTRAGETR